MDETGNGIEEKWMRKEREEKDGKWKGKREKNSKSIISIFSPSLPFYSPPHDLRREERG